MQAVSPSVLFPLRGQNARRVFGNWICARLPNGNTIKQTDLPKVFINIQRNADLLQCKGLCCCQSKGNNCHRKVGNYK